jgi:DNA-binding NtrC family response regulator
MGSGPAGRLVQRSSKLRFRPGAASVRRVTRILVIDDDRAISDLLNQVLSDAGHEVRLVDHLDHVAADAAPDLVITDLVSLDGYDRGSALAAVHRVQERYVGMPIIVCTAYEQAMEESDRLGAAAVLAKPFTIEALIETVARIAAR